MWSLTLERAAWAHRWFCSAGLRCWHSAWWGSAAGCVCGAAAAHSHRLPQDWAGARGSWRGTGLFVERSVPVVAFILCILGHSYFRFLKYAFSFLYSSCGVPGVFVCSCCLCKGVSALCSFTQKGMLEVMKLCSEQK